MTAQQDSPTTTPTTPPAATRSTPAGPSGPSRPAGEAGPASRPARRLTFGFDRFSGLYLGALFIVVFGLWTPDLFLTTDTLHFVAAQQAVAAMLALAVLVPLACGAYDLSIGATINLAAILVAVLQTRQGWDMWPAMGVAVLATTLIGAVNGLVVVKLRVNSFIATLGMATIVAAFQTIASGGSQPFPPIQEAWTQLTQRTVFGFQVIVVYLLVLALVLWWVMAHTPVGRYVYAVGSNADAARLSGVRVDRWTWLSLTVSGGLSGVAGVLYCSLSGPSLTFGPSLLLPAYAAVFLGSTQIKPGRFNVWGTLLAIYVLAIGVQGLQFVTSVQWLNNVFNGVALIVAVAFAVWRQRVTGERKRTAGSTPAAAEEPADPGGPPGTAPPVPPGPPSPDGRQDGGGSGSARTPTDALP